jgi:plastocyanin
MIRRFATLVALMLGACTAGGIPTSSGGGSGTVINVSLTSFAQVPTPYGTSRGYSPSVTTISVGSQIHFVNVDSFQHTATALVGDTSFPSTSPFTAAALNQSGTTISGNWSSGVLQPNGSSQDITIDQAGTYLFGCFYHYDAGMRAAIVAQ